jgi:hypothetical protein
MKTAHVLVLALLAGCATNPAIANSPLEETALSDRIEDRIEAEESLSDAKIRATTDDGVVVLAGVVASDEDAALAGKIAYSTPGVVTVLNELRVGDPREAPEMTPAYDEGVEDVDF